MGDDRDEGGNEGAPVGLPEQTGESIFPTFDKLDEYKMETDERI